MIYRFKSRETADIIMLAPDAERVLSILGKQIRAPGVITWPEMARCIEQLKAEADRERSAVADSVATEVDAGGDAGQASKRSAVSFAQRIVPLVQALERCRQAQKDLIWEV